LLKTTKRNPSGKRKICSFKTICSGWKPIEWEIYGITSFLIIFEALLCSLTLFSHATFSLLQLKNTLVIESVMV